MATTDRAEARSALGRRSHSRGPTLRVVMEIDGVANPRAALAGEQPRSGGGEVARLGVRRIVSEGRSYARPIESAVAVGRARR